MASAFMLELAPLWRGATWVGIGGLARALVSIGGMSLLARYLTNEQFGELQFYLTVAGLSAIAAFTGVTGATTQSVARGFFRTAITGLTLAIKGSLVGAAAMAFAGAVATSYGRSDIGLPLLISAALLPFIYGLGSWPAYFSGRRLFTKRSLFQTISIVSGMVVPVIAVIAGVRSIPLIMLLMFLIPSVANIVIWAYIWTSAEVKSSESEPGSTAYAVKISAWSIVNILGNQIDRLLIVSFMSVESLGMYAVAALMPELAKRAIQATTQLVIPVYAGLSVVDSSIKKFWLVASLAIILFGTVFVLFIQPPLMTPVFGDKYQDAQVASQWLMASVIISALTNLRSGFLFSKLDVHSYRNIHLTSNSLKGLMALVLIPSFGISGAVASVIIYRLALLVVVQIQLRKYNRSNEVRS